MLSKDKPAYFKTSLSSDFSVPYLWHRPFTAKSLTLSFSSTVTFTLTGFSLVAKISKIAALALSTVVFISATYPSATLVSILCWRHRVVISCTLACSCSAAALAFSSTVISFSAIFVLSFFFLSPSVSSSSSVQPSSELSSFLGLPQDFLSVSPQAFPSLGLQAFSSFGFPQAFSSSGLLPQAFSSSGLQPFLSVSPHSFFGLPQAFSSSSLPTPVVASAGIDTIEISNSSHFSTTS